MFGFNLHEGIGGGRLFVAVVAGVFMGLPYRMRYGGLRTHVLVAVGAAYFCLTAVGIVGPKDKELLRVIQGITSGVGFVGAATVLKTPKRVVGLSNAASIWITAAVGCEAGFGSPWLAFLSSAGIGVLSWFMGRFEDQIAGGLHKDENPPPTTQGTKDSPPPKP